MSIVIKKFFLILIQLNSWYIQKNNKQISANRYMETMLLNKLLTVLCCTADIMPVIQCAGRALFWQV
jgi:hypothetical protein